MREARPVLERIGNRVAVPQPAFERLVRRRERKERNKRIAAGLVGVAITLTGFLVAATVLRSGARGTQPGQTSGTPGVNGKIAFSHMVDNTLHVYTVNPGGSDRTQITIGSSASWSPDGTRLVVDRGGQGIFVMNADGSDAVKIADAGERPEPTPRYAFDGGPSITPAFPTWSPDGTRILIARWSNDPIVAYSDRERRTLGSSLLNIVSGSSHLFVVDADGAGMTQLTFGAVADLGGSWSPDGTTIVFSRAAKDASGIYTMNADGTHVRRVVPLSIDETEQHPSWSPDGSRVAFTGYTSRISAPQNDPQFDPGLDFTGSIGIFVAHADGSHVAQLSPDTGRYFEGSPAWSPDGTKIVFECGGICTMGADGSDRVRITRSPTNPFDDFVYPSWGTSPITLPSP